MRTPAQVRDYAQRCSFVEQRHLGGRSVCCWTTPGNTYVATIDVSAGGSADLRTPDVNAGTLPARQAIALAHAYIMLATLGELDEPVTPALLNALYGPAIREATP